MDRRMGIVMFILVTIFTGFGLMIPVMPVIVDNVGAAPYHLGAMLAIYAAISFFVSPLWGALSDRIGRRPVILIGLVGFALSFYIFGIALDSLWLMYLSRILGGCFSGAATSCAMAYVADITSEVERTKGMGLAGMSIGLGFIIGPGIGGLLSHFGLATPFFVATALSLALFAYSFFFLSESLPPEKRSTAGAGIETSVNERQPSRWTAFRGALKYLYLISFVGSFGLAGLEATLQYFEMVKINASPAQIGSMLAISGIVGALIQGGVVRRIKPGNELRTIGLGLLISACGMSLIMLSSSFWNATMFVVLFGAGNTLIRPCVTSMVTKKSQMGYGVATGLVSSMDSLGRMIGPLLGSLLYYVNIYLPFIFTSVVSLLAITLVLGFIASERKQLHPQSTHVG